MRIGYFGGSFDPPHRGHLAVAKAARDRFALDRVLLAPTARQPLKPHGPTASFADRLRMTELLCAGEPGLEASDIDGPRPGGGPNYTADTLRRLRAQLSATEDPHPGEPRVFAIAGADAFLAVRQWRESDQLFVLAEWIVVSRPGFSFADLQAAAFTEEQKAHIHLLEGVEEPISATEVRERLREGADCRSVVPARVLQFIREARLYAS